MFPDESEIINEAKFWHLVQIKNLPMWSTAHMPQSQRTKLFKARAAYQELMVDLAMIPTAVGNFPGREMAELHGEFRSV